MNVHDQDSDFQLKKNPNTVTYKKPWYVIYVHMCV